MASKRRRLAERRKALGFTQEALAHKLGVDATTVRRWESGGRMPQPWLQAKIAQYLQVSPQQLVELLADDATSGPSAEVAVAGAERRSMLLPVVIKGRVVLLPLDAEAVAANGLEPLLRDSLEDGTSSVSVPASDWDAMSPLNRRSLLKHGLTAAALPALGLDDLHHVAVAMEDARRYLDGSVIGHFRKQLVLCKRDDGELGLTRTLPTVLGILGAVEEHAREVKPGVRCELLTVAAECAEFAGWLYRDARHVPRALYWHDRAIEWAQEAGDCAMQGYVLLKKAQLAYDEREPLRMLTLSQAVQAGPWSLPPRVLAEAAQQEARADAMLGGSTHVVERKLDYARNLLQSADADDGSVLSAHYNNTLLTMQTAVCYTEAGQPRRAAELYAESLTEAAFSPRDYGFFLSLMAASQALAGEPDEAARTGVESIARASAAGSHRTRQELDRVLDILKPWQNRPAVQELRHAVWT